MREYRNTLQYNKRPGDNSTASKSLYPYVSHVEENDSIFAITRESKLF